MMNTGTMEFSSALARIAFDDSSGTIDTGSMELNTDEARIVLKATSTIPQAIVVHELSSDFPIGWGPGFARGPEECAPEYASLWDGLVGLWCPELGKTEGELMDVSRQNVTGTINGPIWEPGGLHFDPGDDEILVNKFDTLVPNGDFTFGCQFSPDVTYEGSGDPKYLFRIGGTGSSNDVAIHISGTDGKLYFGVYQGGWKYATTTQASWTAGVPYTVVCTMGKDGMRVYINGILDGTNSNTARTGTSIGACKIGRYLAQVNTSLDGVLHWASGWNRGLSSSEVRLLSEDGATGMLTPSVKHIWNVSSTATPAVIEVPPSRHIYYIS